MNLRPQETEFLDLIAMFERATASGEQIRLAEQISTMIDCVHFSRDEWVSLSARMGAVTFRITREKPEVWIQ